MFILENQVFFILIASLTCYQNIPFSFISRLQGIFLLAHKGHIVDFYFYKRIFILLTSAGQWPVRLTIGCTAAGLTRCRLRTFVMAKIYHTRNNPYFFI